MSQQDARYTSALVDYVYGLRLQDLPSSVVHQAKRVLLDTIGCMLAASAPPYLASAAITSWVRSSGGSSQATVAGSGLRVPSALAALANGTLADNIELDDSHPLSGAHVAAVIVPAALAVAEQAGQSGSALLCAIILGYDLDVRLVLAMNPSSLYARGFHPSAVCGCFGAAASAASLLALNPQQIRNALGLAGSFASGLMAWETDPTQMPKSLQLGIAAHNGITAASLAQLGVSGPPAIFEGRYGAVGAFSDQPRWESLSSELGRRFEISLTGFKKYACCRFLHAALDAFLAIRQKSVPNPRDIQRIVVRLPEAGAPIVDGNELLSHNAQYVLAVAAREGRVLPEHIYSDLRGEPFIDALSQHVQVVADPELSKVYPGRFSEPAVVEVTTYDGARWVERSDYASGDPEKPLSDQELQDKFTTLARTVTSTERASQIASVVAGIESSRSVRDLTHLLAIDV